MYVTKYIVQNEKAMGINSSLHSVVDPLLRAIHTLLVQEDETIKPKEAIMAEILTNEWFDEFESLTESEFQAYAAEQENNHEIKLALFHTFEDHQSSKGEYGIERICQQLLAFYRSGDALLQKFTMQYIPTLIFLHLLDRNMFPAVKTLLVSLYNLEVVDSKGQPRLKTFRVPSIAQSSIFHDSTNLEPAFIAENSLRRWEECNSKLVSWGPLPQVESINAQNRQRVVTALMFLYNQQLADVCLQGIEHACRAISRLVSQGFHMGSSRNSTDSDNMQHPITGQMRLIVSNPLLLEFVHLVYHAMDRGAASATQTLHDLARRATYETYADVLLAVNAVQNLVHRSPASRVQKPSHKQGISKSMITNASFRTKKLPDDIPIQEQEAESRFDSIAEEQEWTEKEKSRGKAASALKLPKLHGLSKKPKVKNSPTPPRHSLENDPSVELRMGAGDQISFMTGLGDPPPSDSNQAVHVSTV